MRPGVERRGRSGVRLRGLRRGPGVGRGGLCLRSGVRRAGLCLRPGVRRPRVLRAGIRRPRIRSPRVRRPRVWRDGIAGARLAGTWATEALRIAAWRPRWSDVDHRTIPHELDLLRTAVHLTKGCYRGQETVARVHNLGRPPRRLVLLHLDGSGHVLPEPGAQVMAGERAVGTVTSVARHHELGPIALAVVRRSVPAQDTLLVAAPDGAVAAAQEIVVSPDHTPAVRTAPQVTRGLRPPTRT